MTSEQPAREFRGGLILGLERDDPVEIVDYEPVWPARFEELRRRLAEALGPLAKRIEHVGSTAVPGLAAKPVVDVQVSIDDLDDEDAYVPAVEAVGFKLRYRASHWRYFRPPPGLPRTAQIHVVPSGSDWEREHLLFPAFLRASPDRAAEYAALKRELAARYGRDRVGYNDAKTDFIAETLRHAEKWARRTGWTV
jgi:GrpB-like predicted nucleotidyltransferase (UPF0157 family)